ncbi:MAG: S-methyl-5-thioribose-1-phosphate isomerase [Candidatus Eremiobacteraeota bacterium]|nr:S-methyl-5-thioribose-1-phosphate isomerase [Candidatus Eremiobacteraeota bacterium]
MNDRKKFSPSASSRHIEYRPGILRLLDQTRLPAETAFVEARTWQEVAEAIAHLRVRGAPAIGIAAAYALALHAHHLTDQNASTATFTSGLRTAADGLIASRPTAVNLSWAVNRLLRYAQAQLAQNTTLPEIAASLDTLAQEIHADDIEACRSIGRYGSGLFDAQVSILTHCNTGDLATGGYGTALGIIRSLWQEGKLTGVYVDETRPLLQGSRLTAWELQRDGIPYTLIADNMAASCMQRGAIDAVIVGADRIARNGDTANKIGTYGLAVLARAHGIPFIVAAPCSTLDASLASGDQIVIEQRNPAEVTSFAGVAAAPDGATASNPAFDITPAAFITGIVTETGVLRPPYETDIQRVSAQPPERVAP